MGTPRTWFQFNERFKIGLRAAQIGWLNCHYHVHDLHTHDTEKVKSHFNAKETIKSLVDAVCCENRDDFKNDPPKLQRLDKKHVETQARTKEAISRLVAAVPKYKAMDPPEPSHRCGPRLTIVLIGRTNVGKTSFTNALTGLGLATSIKGRCTVHISQAPYYGKWYAEDGRVWEFEVIDTPGVDDSIEQDAKTMELLTSEFTRRGHIHAVVLVGNAMAPTIDNALLLAIRKYHDNIFGDVFVSNWGITYNKWFLEHQDEDAEESIVHEAKRVFTEIPVKTLNPDKPTPLGLIPAEFFFQDCVPDEKRENPEAVRNFFERVDNFFSWVSSLKPMQTKVFLSYRKCKQDDILNKQILRPWWHENFELTAKGTMLELTHTSFRAMKTLMFFGLAGKFYNVRVIRLLFREDLRETPEETEKVLKYLATSKKVTLELLFDRLEGFGQLFLEELEEHEPEGADFWTQNRVRNYDCKMVHYAVAPLAEHSETSA